MCNERSERRRGGGGREKNKKKAKGKINRKDIKISS
jgi:hypothetical protein